MSQTRTRMGESISPGTDVDMFSYTVVAGQRLAFDIDRPSGSLDSYVRLFNSSGAQLAANDDGPTPGEPAGLESYLEYTFSAAGTFYVGVSGYGNSGYAATTGTGDTNGSTGVYTLILTSLTAPNTDDNDQISEATILGSMTQNRTWPSGTIEQPSDVDMFSYTVVAGQQLAFDVDWPSGSLDSYLRLFDGNGRELRVNDDGAAPGEPFTSQSYVEYTFLTSGTFYVGVSGFGNSSYNPLTGDSDTSGRTGAYTLIVSSPRSITGVIEGSDLGLGLRSSIRVTLARADGSSEPIDPTRPTWLIIHGRNSRAADLAQLVSAVDNHSAIDQVLTLDWSEGASDNVRDILGDFRLQGSRWIVPVAAWAANTMQWQGIAASLVDEIAHSWGAHVGNEIARSLAAATGSRVRSFVALDPATLPPIGIDGNQYTRSTDFSTNSRFSWGFFESGNDVLWLILFRRYRP